MQKTQALVFILLFLTHALWTQQDDSPSANTQDSQIVEDSGAPQGYIITASDLLLEISRAYAAIDDVQADLTIVQDTQSSRAKLFVKTPSLFRIQYESPAGQLIVSDGLVYQIYLPQQNVVLSQKKGVETAEVSAGAGGVAGVFNEEGLLQLRRNYFSSFVDSPSYKRIDGIAEPVISIKLTWKYPTQSFRELVLHVGKDNIIYRVTGLTYNNSSVSFSFDNIRLNEGIPSTLFVYDPPPSASVIEDFLQE